MIKTIEKRYCDCCNREIIDTYGVYVNISTMQPAQFRQIHGKDICTSCFSEILDNISYEIQEEQFLKHFDKVSKDKIYKIELQKQGIQPC